MPVQTGGTRGYWEKTAREFDRTFAVTKQAAKNLVEAIEKRDPVAIADAIDEIKSGEKKAIKGGYL